MSDKHRGIFGMGYVYYRHDNDDDESLCRECAMKIWAECKLLPGYSSQYRAFEVPAGNPIQCDRCKGDIHPYWTCCLEPVKDGPCCELSK